MLDLNVDQIVNGAVPADWDAFIASLIHERYSLSPAECRVLRNGGATEILDSDGEILGFTLPDGRRLVEGSAFFLEPNHII